MTFVNFWTLTMLTVSSYSGQSTYLLYCADFFISLNSNNIHEDLQSFYIERSAMENRLLPRPP